MAMKIDRSYEGFINSFGVAISICTLLVSIGKYITSFYFLYIVACLFLILITLQICDCYLNKPKSLNLKRDIEKHCLKEEKIQISRKQIVSIKVDPPVEEPASHVPHLQNGKGKSSLRKWSSTQGIDKKKDEVHLVVGTFNVKRHSSMKQLGCSTAATAELQNDAIGSKHAAKKRQQFLDKVGITLTKERKAHSSLKKRAKLNIFSTKEGQKCTIGTSV